MNFETSKKERIQISETGRKTPFPEEPVKSTQRDKYYDYRNNIIPVEMVEFDKVHRLVATQINTTKWSLGGAHLISPHHSLTHGGS